MKRKTWMAILKLSGIVLLITILASAAIIGYLLFRGELNSKAFSEGAFFASIAFIVLAITPIYEVLSSTNHISYMYGEYAVKGKIDVEDRIEDALSRKNYRFSIMMVAASCLLFGISALFGRLL